ncbi:MAG: hypothetical protein O6951_00305, partial [Actinobacteria bacterium]|nr:hypothetical protein [Actinomycetota bacterium]
MNPSVHRRRSPTWSSETGSISIYNLEMQIVMLICIILFSIGAWNLIRAPKMLRPEAPPCFVRMEQLAGFLEASAGMIEGKAEVWTAAWL